MESRSAGPVSTVHPGSWPGTRLVVRLLGTLRVARDGVEISLPTSRKTRGLLAYLVTAPRPVHRTRLCEIFWDVPNDPRSELRWSLSKLRGLLDEPDRKRVRADQDLIAIDTSDLAVDALWVERHLDAALAGDDPRVLFDLSALFEGEFLDGLMAERIPLFEAWVIAQRERCRSALSRILSRLATLLPVSSEQRLAVLRQRIELHPEDQQVHNDLLATLAAMGRFTEGETHLSLARRLLRSHNAKADGLERSWRALRHAGPQLLRDPIASLPPAVETVPEASTGSGIAADIALHNLPPLLSSYIGRVDEQRELAARLRQYRLVTLVGPGGSGKTRLATEIGRAGAADRFDAVWMVELAALSDPQVVGETLCITLGVAVTSAHPAAQAAAAYLRHRSALIILDNCEHLLDAVSDLVQELLRTCPQLAILATSRERLGITGESVYQIPGLGLPTSAEPLSPSRAMQHDAIRLFAERARSMLQTFELSDANVEAVANICMQLDGIPMAIELVVPQLRMLQPQQLAVRLRDRVLLVMRGERGSLPRHRTLGALFDWSYNLLSEPERALLRRLSVFAGTWSLEGAATVTSGDLFSSDDVFDLLSSLVEKSLVIADLRDPVPRYGLLQTTLQYALARRAESQDPDLHPRLAAFMRDLFFAADRDWATTPTDLWLALYEPDLDNLRASLEWAFGTSGDAAVGVELCAYSLRMWDDLALLSERERWFSLAFERRSADTASGVLGRLWLGRLSNSTQGDRTNFPLAKEAADLFRQANDRAGLGEALVKAGAALEAPGTTAEAIPLLEEGLALLSETGPTKPLAHGLRTLAIARYFDRDFAGARPLLHGSETAARAVGDTRGLAAVQIAAAELAFAASETEVAIAETKAMLAGQHCNQRQAVLGLTNLISYLLAAGQAEEARLIARRALPEARALDWRPAIVRIVEHLALIAMLAGDAATAARMLGYSVAFYEDGTASREYTELASYERLTAALSSALVPDLATQLMAEGGRWTLDQAIQAAIAVSGTNLVKVS